MSLYKRLSAEEKFDLLFPLDLKTDAGLMQLKEDLGNTPQMELSYRLGCSPKSLVPITSSVDCYNAFKASWDEGKSEFQEQFKVMMLNRANLVLGIYEVSTGGVSGTVADPKLMFSAALLCCASSIILAHNHPSGSLKPSTADIALTNKMKKAGQFLDLPVLDHLIMTREDYYSFADEGHL